MELLGNLDDGSVMTDNLYNGVALNGKGITRLFFWHGSIREGKGILMKEATKPLSTVNRKK